MYPSISLGPFVFPVASLLYLLGVAVSLNVVERAAKLLKLDYNAIYATAVTGLVSGMIGARLVFVALYWSAFQDNPLAIIWPLNSGYNLAGGLIFGAAGLLFYGRYKKLPLASTADAMIPGVVTGLIFISLADFLAGPGMGTYSRQFWAMDVYGALRHPVQIYEIIGGVLALLVWLKMRPSRLFDGQLFLMTTAVYAAGRLFTDAFRQSSWFTADGYRIIQIISLVVMLICLYALNHQIEKVKEASMQSEERRLEGNTENL